MLEKGIIVLNYEVNQLVSNIKKMELMLDKITMKATTETKNKDNEPGVWFCCKICYYKSKKEVTLKKHINTKHPKGFYECDKCGQTFISDEALESRIKVNHNDDQEKQRGLLPESSNNISKVKECSLCEDRFPTYEEFKIQVANHLTEIQEIDIEYLKSRQ